MLQVMQLQSDSVVHHREVQRWTAEHRRWQRREAELEALYTQRSAPSRHTDPDSTRAWQASTAQEREARRKAEESSKSLDAEVEFLRGELDDMRSTTAADNARQDRVVAKLIATVEELSYKSEK